MTLRDHYGDPIADRATSDRLWSLTTPRGPVRPHDHGATFETWLASVGGLAPSTDPEAPAPSLPSSLAVVGRAIPSDGTPCASAGCTRPRAAMRPDSRADLAPFCRECRRRAFDAVRNGLVYERDMAAIASASPRPVNAPFGSTPEEVAAIARVQALRADGLTLKAITRQLAEEGYRSRAGKPHAKSRVYVLLARGVA